MSAAAWESFGKEAAATMLGLVKLLHSLSEAIPILRSLLMDLVSMLKEINASQRLQDKNVEVCSRIDSILLRMHHHKTGEQSETNEQG